MSSTQHLTAHIIAHDRNHHSTTISYAKSHRTSRGGKYSQRGCWRRSNSPLTVSQHARQVCKLSAITAQTDTTPSLRTPSTTVRNPWRQQVSAPGLMSSIHGKARNGGGTSSPTLRPLLHDLQWPIEKTRGYIQSVTSQQVLHDLIAEWPRGQVPEVCGIRSKTAVQI